jgi:hypothetical protein
MREAYSTGITYASVSKDYVNCSYRNCPRRRYVSRRSTDAQSVHNGFRPTLRATLQLCRRRTTAEAQEPSFAMRGRGKASESFRLLPERNSYNTL